MGNLVSPVSRRHQLLIGNLPSDLPPEEFKLFSLSQLIFDIEDVSVGSISESMGFRIIDKIDLSVSNMSSKTNHSLTKNESIESKVHNHSFNSAITLSLHEPPALFYVLITDKPFYFSQTFSQWLTSHRFSNLFPPLCCRPEKRNIYLQLIDSFPDCIVGFEIDLKHSGGNTTFFCLLQKIMDAFFDGMTVSILPSINILKAKWNIKTRIHQKTGTTQYFVQDFFPKLKMVLPQDGFCIMGVSWTDLYPAEQLNFVLGEAHYIQKSGMLCFGRFEPKTFDPETHTDISEVDDKLLWRILKVC